MNKNIETNETPANVEAMSFEKEQQLNLDTIDLFAKSMAAKMDIAQLNGKSKWWDKESFTTEDLRSKLMRCISAGDFVDAANYMAMAVVRGDNITFGVY